MRHIQPPDSFADAASPVVFLAGSIEMGAAEPWQAKAVAALADTDATVLNPRRAAWDASWKQSMANPEFNRQVTWEMDGLDRADVVAFYFDPATKSPISLLELGLVKDKHVLVCCPDGFWRKGNVEMVCDRFRLPLFARLEDLLAAVRDEVT